MLMFDPNDEDYESDHDGGSITQHENENQIPTRESPTPENLLEDRNDHNSANERRKRKIRPEPENWVKSKSKRLRKEGKPYTGYSRVQRRRSYAQYTKERSKNRTFMRIKGMP